ncbi:MAG: hypothetical protein AABN34_27905 [Acidobacteriota bacterium]
MKIEIKGLEETKRKLDDLQRRAKELHGQHSVSFSELFPPQFMKKHTDFDSFESLVAASGFKVESQKDFGAIPDKEWDGFIQAHSQFADWKEMLNTAGQAYMVRKMGF